MFHTQFSWNKKASENENGKENGCKDTQTTK